MSWIDLDNVERWRMLAEEIRTYADNARDRASRDTLQRIAEEYELLADKAERRRGP